VSDLGLPPEALQRRVVRDALEFSRAAHAGQVRKGDDSPYINHPIDVARTLFDAGYGDFVVAAGLLHDVVEDCDVPIEEIKRRFGEEVASLVAALTADETILDYDERKNEHRKMVEWTGLPATAIYAADKLGNLRSLRAAYERQGEALGNRFNAPLDVKLEHARRDIAMLSKFQALPMFVDELERELERIVQLRDVNPR
jgi:guanosine-3',5'-bis(diphosphate) 3'-pyrophosphohydrolase